MPGPDFLSFFPYGVFGGRFCTLTGCFSLIAFPVAMFIFFFTIIKMGYGVTPRPYPIFSRIC